MGGALSKNTVQVLYFKKDNVVDITTMSIKLTCNVPNEESSYALKASLMLMKRYKAGSQISPELWHASTHDWPSSEVKSLSALRGGQDV